MPGLAVLLGRAARLADGDALPGPRARSAGQAVEALGSSSSSRPAISRPREQRRRRVLVLHTDMTALDYVFGHSGDVVLFFANHAGREESSGGASGGANSALKLRALTCKTTCCYMYIVRTSMDASAHGRWSIFLARVSVSWELAVPSGRIGRGTI
ncbi:hypothetical protein PHYSODRAFT_306332 [Phytophthora sojae]|uniref:Uncharacterized protein n=1 Tax=Phytophthora sojae (strain P6497) TaxID=1094619 RepID=G5A949_PHYSP|nr:hypothetical protein PHYSODRAFT_306332 [Phytophthora sojae]EGZ08425.1 hypothetical protein PHYSODRAFT_306332 [Phytophthora sojae]|eukprot:XP_009536597.1 hypothetical protein PHYSODRAFT_306332 [Phytophthora sojae]